MSINKEVFKNKKNKVFAGAAKRNPGSNRKYGEVEDTESKEEKKKKEDKKRDKELAKAKKAIKKAKGTKGKIVDRSRNTAYG
tara:strand:- start:951 stop:1196 length:246 start_codon:yes stop_codon:yes gene_type:complete